MAGKKRQKVREKDATGLKYFDRLLPLLARLHDVGCERDKAGNRQLHFDQYCTLLLLFIFNPLVRSLRAIQQASQFRNVQRNPGCRHLLSHDPVGIEIQTYCAIIACMPISLWTGRKPTLRTYEMICYYCMGSAEEDELLAHLAKLQEQDASA